MTVLKFTPFTKLVAVSMVLGAVTTLVLWKLIPMLASLFLGSLMTSLFMFLIQFIPASTFFFFLLKKWQSRSNKKGTKS